MHQACISANLLQARFHNSSSSCGCCRARNGTCTLNTFVVVFVVVAALLLLSLLPDSSEATTTPLKSRGLGFLGISLLSWPIPNWDCYEGKTHLRPQRPKRCGDKFGNALAHLQTVVHQHSQIKQNNAPFRGGSAQLRNRPCALRLDGNLRMLPSLDTRTPAF